MVRTAIGVLVFLAAVAVANGAETTEPELPPGWKFVMPAGNAAAGKEAFRTLKCTQCHAVPGTDLPPTRQQDVGPALGPGYSKLPAEYLAESIVNRHQHIAGTLEQYTGADKVSSKMLDFSQQMSVRQLIDIVEFLRQPRAAAK